MRGERRREGAIRGHVTSPSPNCGGGGGGDRVPAELQQQLRAPQCRAQDAPAQARGECRLRVGDLGDEGRGQARWRRGGAGDPRGHQPCRGAGSGSTLGAPSPRRHHSCHPPGGTAEKWAHWGEASPASPKGGISLLGAGKSGSSLAIALGLDVLASPGT